MSPSLLPGICAVTGRSICYRFRKISTVIEVSTMKLRVAIFIALLSSSLSAQVTYDRLLRADREPQNWLTYSGGYASHRYSSLSQINRSNVKNLQLKWSYHPLYAKNTNNQNKMENTPLVVDGVVYTGTALEVVALDAVTGRQYWKFSRPLDPKAYYNAYEVNKGTGDRGRHAVLGHGGLPSARDRRRRPAASIWDKLLADYRKGYQYNVAPLVIKDKVDPRAGDERSRRQLLGGGLRRQDRQRALAVRHRSHLGRCARGEDLGRRFLEARRQSDLERRAATIRKRT